MADQLHTVLRRQLKRCFAELERVPAELQPLIDLVNDAYVNADTDRSMLERSLEISSEELGDANGQLRSAVEQLQAAHRDMEARVIERTQALESAHERLRQAAKMEAVGQLAGGVAHDFNNLLTVIGGCAQLLLMSDGLQDADRLELDEIRRATERAASLTHQLLAFSRRQVLEPKTVDLNQIVVSSQKMLARVIREDIALLVNPSPGPAWVRVDPNQIEQVILNLVLNSRDAMPRGGQIKMTISRAPARLSPGPGLPAMGRSVVLRVTDNGIGMSPEVRERVFEPFFTTKESGRGTGLGLASVYGIVRQSNGTIAVESTEGSGTTFTIVFPAAAAPEGALSADDSDANAAGRQELVLLVEDEDAVRRVLRVMLEQHGYKVLEASSAAQALEIVGERARDLKLLVSDVVMPDMNGPALAQRLIAQHPDLVVLFISGYTDIDPEALRLGHRNVGFLSKPIEAARLAAKVRELVVAT